MTPPVGLQLQQRPAQHKRRHVEINHQAPHARHSRAVASGDRPRGDPTSRPAANRRSSPSATGSSPWRESAAQRSPERPRRRPHATTEHRERLAGPGGAMSPLVRVNANNSVRGDSRSTATRKSLTLSTPLTPHATKRKLHFTLNQNSFQRFLATSSRHRFRRVVRSDIIPLRLAANPCPVPVKQTLSIDIRSSPKWTGRKAIFRR
jgi:hypothetical protein